MGKKMVSINPNFIVSIDWDVADESMCRITLVNKMSITVSKSTGAEILRRGTFITSSEENAK